MKNKIFLVILMSVFVCYQTIAQTDIKPDSVKNKTSSDLNLFPLKTGRINQMPFNSINSLSMLNPSAYYLKGNRMFYYGIEATGDYIYIDGMQINNASDFPFRSIGSYNFYGLSSPINFGNSLAGFINIQSPEIGDKTVFNIEVNKDLKKYYNDYLLEFNIATPININKKIAKKKNPSIFISGSYYNTNNTDPIWEDQYMLKTEVLDDLKKNPVRISGTGFGIYQEAEYVKMDMFTTKQSPQNAGKDALNLYSKLNIPLTNNIKLTLGNYSKIEDSDLFIFDNAIFNSSNNPDQIIKNFDNYLNFEHKIKISEDLNIGYQIFFQYSNYHQKLQSKKHKDDFFKYGYLGKFDTHTIKSYAIGDDTITGMTDIWIQNGFFDTAYTFQNLNYNPEAARITELYYELYPDKWGNYYYGGGDGNWMNSAQVQLGGGLLNGQNPHSVYSLWNAQGTQFPGYLENSEEKIRGNFNFNLDYKSHHFTAGFEYMKEIQRQYWINPTNLWGLMRGLTNFHIEQFDVENPQFVYDHGIFQDTIFYFRKYDEDAQRVFDYNLRKKLGLPTNGTDYILTDSYDMINQTISYYDKDGIMQTIHVGDELYTLDMFSPDELFNDGNSYVQYYGYDYTGKKTNNKSNPYSFFNDRTIDAFRPLYLSAYIQDSFSWKNFNVSIGLRIDRYDANQPVLKDKYLLMEAYNAGELREGDENWVIPEDISDDYSVYVDDCYHPTRIIGYRKNETWFDRDGNIISDPSIIDPSGIKPYLKYPKLWLSDEGWTPDMIFEDYEAAVNLLPQISIDYTTKDFTNIYFTYNTYTQNPRYINRFSPERYQFFQTNKRIFPNPNLKPLRVEKLNLGVKRPIYKTIYADVSFLMIYLKNYYYIDYVLGAYPHNYITISNNKETIINKGLIASINYFSPKTSGFNLSACITKLFPDKEAINYTEISDLVVNSYAGFNFGNGHDYVGPTTRMKNVLENFGLSIYYQFRKGTPYPLYYKGDSFEYTPDFNMVNLKLEKGFYFKNKMGINIYVLIENLLNNKNIFYVYPYTGKPDDDGFLAMASNQSMINQHNDPESFRTLYQLKLQNPQHYGIPRIIRIGCRLSF
jgi:hypothetical protein